MRTRLIRTLPAALLPLLFAGCTDGGEPAPQPAPKAPTLADWHRADQSFGCTAFVCVFGIAPSESVAFCGDDRGLLADREAALKAGRLAFDGKRARGCIEALGKLTPANCWGEDALALDDAIADGEAACDGVLTGTVANDAACRDDEECAGGWCDASAQVCPGRCASRRGAGEDCSRDEMCADGLECAGRRCVRPAAASEACGATKPCGAGLRCIDAACVPPLARGEECDPGAADCAKDLYCAPDAAAATGGRCADRLAEGAECRVGATLLGINSPACRGNQVCIGMVTDDEGEVLLPGRCGAPADVGGACDPPNGNPGADPSDAGCFLALRCDGASKRCVALPAAGEACFEEECRQDSFCDDAGTCRALKPDGADCTRSSECLHACDSATNECAPAPACHVP